MKHSALTLSVILFLSLSTVHAYGREPVKVAMLELPGWVDSNCNGVLPNIVKTAFQQRGFEMECIVTPPTRQLTSVMDEVVDCAFPFPSYASKIPSLYITDYAVTFENVIFSLRNEPFNTASLSEKRIAAFPNASKLLGDELHSLIKGNPNYLEQASSFNRVKMLMAGRVDYIFSEKRTLKAVVEQNKLNTNFYIYYAFSPSKVPGACRDAQLVEEFNQGLNKLSKTGELNKIYERYD